MEQTLAKLDETWKVVEFDFEQHARHGRLPHQAAEENFEMLEENQLVVQGMMASKYLATFEEEVDGWQKKLSSSPTCSRRCGDAAQVGLPRDALHRLRGGEEGAARGRRALRGHRRDFKVTLRRFHRRRTAVNACATPRAC